MNNAPTFCLRDELSGGRNLPLDDKCKNIGASIQAVFGGLPLHGSRYQGSFGLSSTIFHL